MSAFPSAWRGRLMAFQLIPNAAVLSDEALRVPCLISCPRLGLKPQRLSAPFDVGIDMLPTLLDLCGYARVI